MDSGILINDLRNRMKRNLTECILPFWRNHVPDVLHGGFYGRVDGNCVPDIKSPKSVVLNCRIMWTFSKAYEMFGNSKDRELAKRAFDYIRTNFWDEIYEGVYWMVTCKGEPSEVEKRTYGQAFFIYSMAEYYRVFHDMEALELSLRVFTLVEEHLKLESGGYADSAARDWQKDEWVNFWVKNRTGAAKLLNSNMHLFEAILTLAEVTRDFNVMKSLKEQLEFLIETAMDSKLGHFKAGMDANGNRLDGEINYGHDCECSYLMTQAAELLQDESLINRVAAMNERMMNQVYETGIDHSAGGMYYIADYRTGEKNCSKIWWVQAEGITAFFDLYQRTGKEKYLYAAISIWDYVEKYMVNQEMGEWFSVGRNPCSSEEIRKQEEQLSAVFTNDEMAGKGKCPYHNSRVCFEIMSRAETELKRAR